MSVDVVVKKRGKPKRVDLDDSIILVSSKPINEKLSKRPRKKILEDVHNGKNEILENPENKSAKSSPLKEREEEKSSKTRKATTLSKRSAKKQPLPSVSGHSATSSSAILQKATAFTEATKEDPAKTAAIAYALVRPKEQDLDLHKSKLVSEEIEKPFTVEPQLSTLDDKSLVKPNQSETGRDLSSGETGQDDLTTTARYHAPIGSSLSSASNNKSNSKSIQSDMNPGRKNLEDIEIQDFGTEVTTSKSDQDILVQSPGTTFLIEENKSTNTSADQIHVQFSEPKPDPVTREVTSPNVRMYPESKGNLEPTNVSRQSMQTNPPQSQTSTSRYRLPTTIPPQVPPLRPTQLPYNELKKNPEFKALSRKYTGLMVGIPILLTTSYVLWERYKKQVADRQSTDLFGFNFPSFGQNPDTNPTNDGNDSSVIKDS